MRAVLETEPGIDWPRRSIAFGGDSLRHLLGRGRRVAADLLIAAALEGKLFCCAVSMQQAVGLVPPYPGRPEEIPLDLPPAPARLLVGVPCGVIPSAGKIAINY